jgi:hypothetical protein
LILWRFTKDLNVKYSTMNFGFPTRFLKKLDIYQQIRNGQGLSKHKKLWKYEAAFLKTAYGPCHQFLNSSISLRQFKEWIKKGDSEYEGRKYQEILGNLFWRGYLQIVSVDRGNSATRRILSSNEAAALGNQLVTQGTGTSNHEFLLTESGLLVGEVLSEIENDKWVLKYWNTYRYSLAIDLFWLLIFFGLASVFFSSSVKEIFDFIKTVKMHIFGIDFGYKYLIAVFVFVEWLLMNFIYREVYAAIEKRD